MPTPVDPDFRARLAALGDKYAAGVPALMAAIAQALQHCEEAGATDANLAALQKQLHTIAGSAGTFGFGALGGECRRLEQLTRTLRDGPADAQAWPQLAAQTRQLLRWAAVDARAATYQAPESV